jgi:hypothetical protein
LSHLYIKCIILPRQARDKHRENSKNGRFLQGSVTRSGSTMRVLLSRRRVGSGRKASRGSLSGPGEQKELDFLQVMVN